MSLRIAAQTMDLRFLPLALRRSKKARMMGLYRHALSAGRYSALRKAGSPALEIRVLPTLLPDAWTAGARAA